MIKVLFFGATAEAVNSRKIDMKIEGEVTIGSVIDRLKESHPRLANQILLASINQEHVELTTIVSEGDEIAIFTAVSGG